MCFSNSREWEIDVFEWGDEQHVRLTEIEDIPLRIGENKTLKGMLWIAIVC